MNTKPATLAAAGTVLLWASAFPAITVAVRGLGPAGLAVARLVVASAALAVVAPVLGVRRPRPRDLPLRMPFFPVLQIAGLILLAAILITMGLDTDFWNISWIVGVPWLALLSAAYFLWKRRRGVSPISP